MTRTDSAWIGRLASLVALVAILVSLTAPPLRAQNFRMIATRAGFLDLVEGQTLRALGVSMYIYRSGRIGGTAFGYRIDGEWRWRDEFFCRRLTWGEQERPMNCMTVGEMGPILRMTTDEGTGEPITFRLD